MRFRGKSLVLILAGIFTADASAQELSYLTPEVVAEIEEFLIDGRISGVTYRELIDLSALRVDLGRTTHLEPNLIVEGSTVPGLKPLLALRQLVDNRFHVEAGYWYEDASVERERSLLRASYRQTGGLYAEFDYRREYDDRTLWRTRSITLPLDAGTSNRIRIGSFTGKIGLGLNYGYRGRLLAREGITATESFLFPALAGNGIDGHASIGRLQLRGLIDVNRNPTHEIVTGLVALGSRRWIDRPTAAMSYSEIRNRQSDRRIGLVTISQAVATYLIERNSRGLEVSMQFLEDRPAFAMVGHFHRELSDAVVRVSGWWYHARWQDWRSGSLAVPVSRTYYLPDVEFAYDNKRAGQAGGTIGVQSVPLGDWLMTAGIVAGGYSSSHANVDLRLVLERDIGRFQWVEFIYLLRDRIRPDGDDPDDPTSQEAGGRWKYGRAGDQFFAILGASLDIERRSDPLSIEGEMKAQRGLVSLNLKSRASQISESGIGRWWVRLSSDFSMMPGLTGTLFVRFLSRRTVSDPPDVSAHVIEDIHTLGLQLTGVW